MSNKKAPTTCSENPNKIHHITSVYQSMSMISGSDALYTFQPAKYPSVSTKEKHSRNGLHGKIIHLFPPVMSSLKLYLQFPKGKAFYFSGLDDFNLDFECTQWSLNVPASDCPLGGIFTVFWTEPYCIYIRDNVFYASSFPLLLFECSTQYRSTFLTHLWIIKARKYKAILGHWNWVQAFSGKSMKKEKGVFFLNSSCVPVPSWVSYTHSMI